MDEALDHLETKTYELYDQRIFKIEMKVWIREFLVQKGEKNMWNDPVFKRLENTVLERADPLN